MKAFQFLGKIYLQPPFTCSVLNGAQKFIILAILFALNLVIGLVLYFHPSWI